MNSYGLIFSLKDERMPAVHLNSYRSCKYPKSNFNFELFMNTDCSLARADSLGYTQSLQAGKQLSFMHWFSSLCWALAVVTFIISIHVNTCKSTSVWGSKVQRYPASRGNVQLALGMHAQICTPTVNLPWKYSLDKIQFLPYSIHSCVAIRNKHLRITLKNL